MTFNPNEHMFKLKSKEGTKDYLPVQWRLVWFREQCPGGTIDTEELQVDLDREVSIEVSAWNNETRRSEKVVKMAKGYARFRAIVTDGHGGRATGTKSESAVNFADYIEKAETGAIGRALAALGYGTQFTGDELSEGVERLADAPVEQRPSTNGQALHALTAPGSYKQHHGEAPITDQQKASIRKLYEHLGEAVVEDVAAMTYQQAKDAIVDLSARYNQMKGRAPAPVVEIAQANGQADTPAKKIEQLINAFCGTDSKRKYQALREALNIPSGPLPTLDKYTDDDAYRVELYVDSQRSAKAGKS